MTTTRREVVDRIHAVLHVVPPESWTAEECLIALDAYEAIRQHRQATEASYANVIPLLTAGAQ